MTPATAAAAAVEEAPFALPEQSGAGSATETELEVDPQVEKFREERRTSLGGTDLAAIVGMSPWRKPWDVAAEKKGLIPPLESSERMEWGLLLEEPIAKEYARRTGQRIRRVNDLVRDRDLPYLAGHPDRLVIGKRAGVEIKTVAGRSANEWSLPGEPMKVPKHYFVQVQHYLSITRFASWDLVPLFNMTKMRIYPIEPNEQVIRALRQRGQEFWERYVLGDELPPMEPSDTAEAYIKATFPVNTVESFIEANPEQEEWIRKWLEAKARREKAEAEEKKWKLNLQAAIGSATGIRSTETEITWKKDRDSTELVTDYETILHEVCAKHGISVPASLIVQHTRNAITRTGARKMLSRPVKR